MARWVKGAVELDKTALAPCGGALTIFEALISSDTQATGACEATVTRSYLEGDFQADDTRDTVTFAFNETTSDVAANDGDEPPSNGISRIAETENCITSTTGFLEA